MGGRGWAGEGGNGTGGGVPEISLISTNSASSFSRNVSVSDSVVMPEVLATAAAWASVSAALGVMLAYRRCGQGLGSLDL